MLPNTTLANPQNKDLINKTKKELLQYCESKQNDPEAWRKMLNCQQHHIEQKNKGFTDYLLRQQINWFGRTIPAQTLYIQISNDYWIPSINGARVTTMRLDFYTVLNNTDYFVAFDFFA